MYIIPFNKYGNMKITYQFLIIVLDRKGWNWVQIIYEYVILAVT